MRQRATFCLLAVSGLLLLPSLAAAPEPARLVSVGSIPHQAKQEAVWLFGGRTVNLPVVLLVQEKTPAIVADLYLSGGKLGAPTARSLPFKPSGEAAFSSLREGSFSVELPQVTKPIEMLLVLRTDAPDPKSTQEIALIPLRVYPDTFLAQIGKKLASASESGNRLVLSVFGEMKGLRELLRAKQIPFEEGGMDFPSNLSGGTVAVGEVPSDLPLPPPSQAAGSALLVYHPDSASPEKIEETLQGNHLTAIVHHSPPIQWADDVRAQQLLFRLIEKTNPSHE